MMMYMYMYMTVLGQIVQLVTMAVLKGLYDGYSGYMAWTLQASIRILNKVPITSRARQST
jgi:hypothetical protein